MAIGLSKNSPIQLTLTRDNYESLISRHGQWVRWVQGIRCPCVLGSGRADPTCSRCAGDGIYYRFQEEKNLYSKLCPASDGYALIPEEFLQEYQITEVFLNGKKLTDFLVDSGVILSQKIRKIDKVTCHGVVSRRQKKKSLLKAVRNSCGIFEFTDSYVKTEIGNIYPDIVGIEPLDPSIEICSFSRNLVFTKSDTVDFEAVVSFIPAEKFLIHTQTKTEAEGKALNLPSGESSATFPFEFDVSPGDVITLLFACKLQRSVIVSRGGDFDLLPEWFVSEIVSIEGYEKGRDYFLSERNRLIWLSDNRPFAGAPLSVCFRYHPSYRVCPDMGHDTRSSENQLLPRMVSLQLLIQAGDLNEGLF